MDEINSINNENKITLKYIFKEWLLPFAIEALVVILIVKYLVFLTNVPTGSMIPTIEENSWFFSARVYNPLKNVKRGDIIIFKSDEMDLMLTKRVIGLPGDKVEIKEGGKVYINGEYYEEPYVKNPSPKTGSFEVPEGSFLFFGDNRDGSVDARFWENPYIPAEKIYGRAMFMLYPFNDFGPIK